MLRAQREHELRDLHAPQSPVGAYVHAAHGAGGAPGAAAAGGAVADAGAQVDRDLDEVMAHAAAVVEAERDVLRVQGAAAAAGRAAPTGAQPTDEAMAHAAAVVQAEREALRVREAAAAGGRAVLARAPCSQPVALPEAWRRYAQGRAPTSPGVLTRRPRMRGADRPAPEAEPQAVIDLTLVRAPAASGLVVKGWGCFGCAC